MTQSQEHLIMVVDDDFRNLKLMLSLLETSGFNVIVAEDGETAIEKVQSVFPDLILLDVMMPGMDGFETCRRLKYSKMTKDIPIIFMTAISDSVDKVKGLSLGAVDYIIKPFNSEELLARMNLHIRLQQEIKERTNTEIELQKATSELEQRVEARTAELYESIEKLKETQLQLIQSEKMSSIGALVTGIAHELNNPVTILIGNINLAAEYIESIINHIKLYQKEFPNPGSIIEKDRESLDIDFLISDLPQMFSEIKLASDRISEISVSLRSFARTDSTSKVAFNINDCIDSTLMILQHRIKANHQRPAIEIVKNYGDLPNINCYPNTLNQAFISLLVNSINSLEESNLKNSRTYPEIQQNPNRITITTSVIESYSIEIKIADNGPGLLEHMKDKLYEAFVNTKYHTKASSLGLSMSHLIIVNKHGGELECKSHSGQGKEFVIKLPI
ncbi:MAG: response regulator [Microcoleaceae cyanobacterium MO_207.B10]|nr:response regulator [Microcoleaceae cyanobacterium MO_207.B10]